MRDSDKKNLVAVDPGVRSVLTAVRLDTPPGSKHVQISQGEYRDSSFLHYTMKKRGSKSPTFKKYMANIQTTMTNAPSCKSILGFDAYLEALGTVWHKYWKYHSKLELRKVKFFAWRMRESWIQKVVNRFKAFADGGAILFGNGAKNGFFCKLRYIELLLME